MEWEGRASQRPDQGPAGARSWQRGYRDERVIWNGIPKV